MWPFPRKQDSDDVHPYASEVTAAKAAAEKNKIATREVTAALRDVNGAERVNSAMRNIGNVERRGDAQNPGTDEPS